MKDECPSLALLRRPPMSAMRPLSGEMRTSASECLMIEIYEYTP
jgi:hypothetical protein